MEYRYRRYPQCLGYYLALFVLFRLAKTNRKTKRKSPVTGHKASNRRWELERNFMGKFFCNCSPRDFSILSLKHLMLAAVKWEVTELNGLLIWPSTAIPVFLCLQAGFVYWGLSLWNKPSIGGSGKEIVQKLLHCCYVILYVVLKKSVSFIPPSPPFMCMHALNYKI